MNATASIVAYLDKLIAEGEALLSKNFKVETSSFTSGSFVPLDPFRRWVGNCLVLKSKLGRGFEPWEKIVRADVPNKVVRLASVLGTVRSIKDAVQGGHLTTVRDFVVAETFSNLLDQADYLLSKKFWLAAGVLGRAVLEEELRVVAQKFTAKGTAHIQ
jgi:hypothetical protein